MAIAFVQKATATGISATSITTPAFASATTVGNVLVGLGAQATSRTGTATFTDSKSNTWTTHATADGHTLGSNPCIAAIGSASITTGGTSHTVTFKFDTTLANGYQLVVAEYSGLTTSLDSTAGTLTKGTSTTSIAPATGSTTNGNDLVLACMVGDTNSTAVGMSNPPTVNGSTTGVQSLEFVSATTILAFEAAYLITSSTGTQTASWTYSSDSSGGYAAAVIALKGAASGGNTYNVSGSDSLGLSDSPANTLAAKATGSDSLGLADSATTIATRLASGTDSLALSDSAANTATLGASGSDTLALADSGAGGSIFATSASDSLGLSDSSTRTSTLPASGSDSLGLSDAATSKLNATASGSDSLAMSDSGVGRLLAIASGSDSLSLTESASATQSGASATDSLGLTDAASATIQLSLVALDSLGLLDSASATGGAAPSPPPVSTGGSAPGKVVGKKRRNKNTGPYMRDDQVFGEEYPIATRASPTMPDKRVAKPVELKPSSRGHRAAVIRAMLRELL